MVSFDFYTFIRRVMHMAASLGIVVWFSSEISFTDLLSGDPGLSTEEALLLVILGLVLEIFSNTQPD